MRYTWLKNIQAFIYPPTCLLCQAPGVDDLDLCAACRSALPRIDNPCPRCALSRPAGGDGWCGRCQKKPPAFDAAVAAFLYEPPVDYLIQRLKFQGKLSHARLLGHLLADHLIACKSAWPEAIVPVPLHPRRVRERGFNQAQELARIIGNRLRVPVNRDAVKRIRHTKPQMELPAKVRRKNIRGAFNIEHGFVSRHVALIDDVMTTGSTVNEIARSLKRSGVERVQVWCAARAD